MSETLQAALTAAGNFAGYVALFLVTVAALTYAQRRGLTAGRAAAAALILDFELVLVWYVATMFWLDSYPHADQPPWLESTSGIAENIQSEIIQIWIAALVFKWLLWKGAPESKDS
jgi:hypothetical protein